MINHRFAHLVPEETTETTISNVLESEQSSESDSESYSEDLVFRNEPCNFREALCNFFDPKLLEKITFIDNSEDADSQSSDSDF